jgi:hypothetical protein
MDTADCTEPLTIHDRLQMLRRVRAGFLEMPGLVVTPAQAGRLFGLEPEICEAVLTDLVAAGFLVSDAGRYRQLR